MSTCARISACARVCARVHACARVCARVLTFQRVSTRECGVGARVRWSGGRLQRGGSGTRPGRQEWSRECGSGSGPARSCRSTSLKRRHRRALRTYCISFSDTENVVRVCLPGIGSMSVGCRVGKAKVDALLPFFLQVWHCSRRKHRRSRWCETRSLCLADRSDATRQRNKGPMTFRSQSRPLLSMLNLCRGQLYCRPQEGGKASLLAVI